MYVRRSLLRAALRGSVALVKAMQMLFQDANGEDSSTPVLQSQDATQITSAFDIDVKVLGGYAFNVFGAGRIVVQGLEVDFSAKPPTRIPG
jgi:hypothetical protein